MAFSPAIVASALAMSVTVTPDNFASCKSLARLNSSIDTANKTHLVTLSRSYLFQIPSRQHGEAHRITVNSARGGGAFVLRAASGDQTTRLGLMPLNHQNSINLTTTINKMISFICLPPQDKPPCCCTAEP